MAMANLDRQDLQTIIDAYIEEYDELARTRNYLSDLATIIKSPEILDALDESEKKLKIVTSKLKRFRSLKANESNA